MLTGRLLDEHQHVSDSVRHYTFSPLLGALLGLVFWRLYIISAGDGSMAALGATLLLAVLWPIGSWIVGYFVLKWARVGHPGATAGWGTGIFVVLTFIVMQRQPINGWWLVVAGVVAFFLGAALAGRPDRSATDALLR